MKKNHLDQINETYPDLLIEDVKKIEIGQNNDVYEVKKVFR